MGYSKYILLVAIGLLLVNCEGSFDANPIPDEILITQINLNAPPNEEVCLTEGLDGNGDWVVNFQWNTDVPFDGNFILTLTADGNSQTTQNVTSGTSLTLSPNTVYRWQVADESETVTSDTFTFITPAARDEAGSAPPALSAIQVEPNGAEFTISYSVLDADGDLVESVLFIDGTPQNFGQQTNVSTSVSLSPGDITLRVVATDQANNETSTERTYTVQ